MNNAVIIMKVSDQVDVSTIHNIMKEHLPAKTMNNNCSIEILPEAINTNARLYFWHRVCDRDPHDLLTQDQKIAIVLRLTNEDDFLDEKINESIDFDINELKEDTNSEDSKEE
ncbi:MAG: hypothetical protein ACE3L7_14590 [Candidatus Pristimantibacillus sp.]